MYKSENELRKAIEQVFADCGWFTQKIESSGMNTGIPDLFINKNGLSVWLELKLEKCKGPKQGASIKVDWRPGQQAWHKLYFLSNPIVPVLTVIQYLDCIIIVKGTKIYEGRTVAAGEYDRLLAPLYLPSYIDSMRI